MLDLYMVGEDAIVLLQCFDYIQSNFSGDVSSDGYLTLNSKVGYPRLLPQTLEPSTTQYYEGQIMNSNISQYSLVMVELLMKMIQ